MKLHIVTLLIFILSGNALAHEQIHDEQKAKLILAATERPQINIQMEDGYRVITSNGIPNHITGRFPNRNNPNRISEQQHRYRVTTTPALTGRVTKMRGQLFGVALNGIPFDPGTAECYGQPRGGRPGTHCEWREEAIVNGQGRLGLDNSNAHVQPDGTYHYHGIPHGLVASLPAGEPMHIGYAADGFKIYVSPSSHYRSSYQLKSGTRPSGPDGRYDGTYTADFTYTAGSGNLDACNGMEINGEYAYMLTDHFPHIPRCWKGTPDASFSHRPPSSNRRGHPPPRPHRRPL